jgi:2-oxoglutarate dehydrogenase E2 component (dihydrolipoamide succinyltransferase)
MGESIAEGTVSRWLKQVGEAVERDEPLLEISTDKVDAEIPAPSSGRLVEIVVGEGATVEVGTVVAYIDPDAGASENGRPAVPEADATPAPPPSEAPSSATSDVGEAPAPLLAERGEVPTAEDRLRTRSTPVVRKIAQEHGIDVADVPGTGHAGRVTKQDILSFIESTAPETPTAPGLPDASAEAIETPEAAAEEAGGMAAEAARPETAAAPLAALRSSTAR